MRDLSLDTTSFWIASTPDTNFPALTKDIIVDVAIIGAGIAGLTAAILLKRAGKTVVVIESNQIVTGVSGHTTAKVTALHQLVYADLIQNIGEEKTRLYAESNQAAVERVATFVREEQIDCDFRRNSAYTFAKPDDDLSQITAEVEAATKVGLPVSFVQETSLPFPIAGAIKLDNQVQFHVRKYLLHLANLIAGDGSYVFENSRVETVDGNNPCSVITEKGVVKAQDVLVTTHLPILNRGLFFAKSYPKRSYIIAAPIDPQKAPEGMFIGSGEEYNSIRTTPDEDGLLLLVGGKSHKVGTKTDTEECYQALEAFAQENFKIGEIKYRWSTQDMVSFDKLPFIGKLTPLDEHIYVATGFSLWGMSKGTLSGMILSDLVLGKENPWSELYDATRANAFLTPVSIKQNLDVGIHWVGDRLKGTDTDSLVDINVGEGKIVSIEGEKVAAYRDERGQVHAVSAVCTHLACIVNWNEAEKSWDCPCHGARYDYEGKVLHGPAVKDLEPKAAMQEAS